MIACFRCVWFSFSVLSQEIGWEERLRNDVFFSLPTNVTASTSLQVLYTVFQETT